MNELEKFMLARMKKYGLKTLLNFDTDDMVPHVIYCYGRFSYGYNYDLEKLILSSMKKYGLQSTILTGLEMYRRNLITKEKSKEAYQGKLKNEWQWEDYEGSINDDLEFLANG